MREDKWVISDRRRDPPEATASEIAFIQGLEARVDGLQVWFHETAGLPWLITSVDIVDHGRIVATPRVDYFGGTIQGALSPTLLNGDDGVSADHVGVDVDGPLGLPSRTGSADELAEVAASWFSWILATFSLRLE